MPVPFYFGLANFDRIDKDGNGKIYSAEYTKFAGAVFDKATLNGSVDLDFSQRDVILRYKSALK